MKKCKYCGTPQSDERHTCVDCGKVLGKPLSEKEAAAVEDALDEKMDAMTDRTDTFYVSRTDKILGIIGVLGFIAALVLFCAALTELNHIWDAQKEALMQAVQSGDPSNVLQVSNAANPTPYSRANDLDKSVGCASIAIVFYLISVVLLLVPRLFWWWDTMRYRIRYNHEPTPSAFDAACMKFFKYAGLLIGTAALAYGAWMYF